MGIVLLNFSASLFNEGNASKTFLYEQRIFELTEESVNSVSYGDFGGLATLRR